MVVISELRQYVPVKPKPGTPAVRNEVIQSLAEVESGAEAKSCRQGLGRYPEHPETRKSAEEKRNKPTSLTVTGQHPNSGATGQKRQL